MDWISIGQLPHSSGNYLVCIEKKDTIIITFKYIAYFDKEKESWYKYDPFLNKENILEKIESDKFKIKAWSNTLPPLI